MRAFIALSLPTSIKEQIKNLQKKIEQKNLFTGKYTEIKNIHLTLKFLGEVNKKKVVQVQEKLRSIHAQSFHAKIQRLGVFTAQDIKIIWLALENANELQAGVDNALQDLFPKEKRFMGHITIARVKKTDDKETLLNFLQSIDISPMQYEAREFSLKKSALTPQGPLYEDLERYQLE